MELLHCATNVSTQSEPIDWPAVISSLGAILVGLGAIVAGYLQASRSFYEKRLEEKRALIVKKLDEFYGPLIQLREKSNRLYEKFKSKYVAKDQNFSTLLYLLNGYEFQGNDKILLKEIIRIGGLCEDLMHQKAGLIDDIELREVLIPRATTHFLLMKLAFEKAITGMPEEFGDLTFPRKLDIRLKERKTELERELELLLNRS